ncbi:MAG: FtsX-like permease family protein [Pseudomonadota bacterium]
MTIQTAWRFALRELRAGWRDGLRGFRIFIACLALGVAAIAAVGSVRAAIESGLADNGARILGGQAELEFTYRFANDAERAWMDRAAIAQSAIADFRSMVVVETANGAERALTQVKAVDDAYPLVGQVVLAPDMPLAAALAGETGLPGAVLDRLLMDRLDLVPGDTFKMGIQEFVVMAELVEEPDNVGAFGLGPRSLVSLDSLAASGLLAPGTLFSTKYRMMFDDQTNLSDLETQVDQDFAQSGARWQDARNGAPGVSTFVDRLGGFLILVGLSGLAVGGVGVASAVGAYLARKTEVIATLKTLGASRAVIFQTYFIQIGLLSLGAIGLGLALGAAIPLALAPVLQSNLPVPAQVSVYPSALGEAAIYGVLTALAFTLWPLARMDNVRAATLFRDAMASGTWLPKPAYLVALGAVVALLLTTAMFFSGDARLTLWVAGGIVCALGVLVIAALAVRFASKRAGRSRWVRGRTALRLALASIGGPRDEATSVVLSLGLGLSVLAAVGQIDGNLRQTIQGNLPDIAPSYFFVDIQTDQLPGFLDRLDTDPDVSRVETAPMLRGIITQINGRPAAETAGDHWVLQGDRGVTYADGPGENTTITAGTWWPKDYNGPPQISFAAQEANEMGLVLGDTLTVNILGRDITGTLTSFREVDFSTAGIGFILSMSPSALRGAPHSHISTVYATEAAEASILRDLAAAYPNITAIRVRDAIDQVAAVLGSLATATSYGALATLLTGFLVLIGAAAASVSARTYEAAVLKTLGATRRSMTVSFAIRSGLIGLAAGIVALAAGCAAGWAVCTYVLDTSYTIIWPNALAITIGGVLATLLASLAFTAAPLAARPSRVLRAKG